MCNLDFDPDIGSTYANQLHINRTLLSNKYIIGNGIEIGALASPVIYNKNTTNIKYVDKFTHEEALKHYPELKEFGVIQPDIIDDGEYLYTIKNESQDFVIANHFLEHAENPIRTIENIFRVLKNNGILYMAIPDKRYTFDKNRERTKLEHIIDEYLNCSYLKNREEHYLDFNNGNIEDAKIQLQAHYSIHFHIWQKEDLEELFSYIKNTLNFKFEIEEILYNYIENICILRKKEVFISNEEFNELYEKGYKAFKNKEYIKSEFIFGRLILYREKIEFKYLLGKSKLENKKYDEALNYLIEYIEEIDEIDSDLYQDIAICLEKTGDLETAEMYYYKYKELNNI
ncbi:MAG: methyltransferase domain-containing protein [Candidatus Sericytochromatia bacterium]